MAGDFGLDSGGNVVIQRPAGSVAGPSTRVTGGDGGGFTAFASTPQAPRDDFSGAQDSTANALGALNKLTQGALAPLIAAEQKRQYFEGMSAVAQGKALVEIQKEQPWYTQLFGPSATVQGAQAMTLMSKMDEAQSDWMQQMPKLRELPPDAARSYLVDQAGRIANTGDPTMDAMVQAKLAEQWGPMLDLHTKQHVAYVQEQNVTAYGNGLVSAGKSYQSAIGAGTGFFTPEQLDQQKQSALAAFAPIPGMTHDAWSKTTVQGLQSNLMSGNFGIYEAFRGTQGWDQLPIEARTQLERLQPYAVGWAQKNLPAFRDDLSSRTALQVALTQGTGPQTIDALRQYMDQEDAKFRKQAGSTQPVYDNEDRAKMEKAWYQGREFLMRQQAAATKAAQKVQDQVMDAEYQRRTVMDSINHKAISPVAMNNLSADVVQQTLLDARTALEKSGDTAGLQQWMGKLAVASTWGNKMVDHQLSDRLTVAANNFFTQGTPVTSDMRQSLGYMQMLASSENGIAALATYVGGEQAAKMTALVKSGVDLSDKSAVDAARQAIANGWNADVTQKDIKAVASYLSDQDPGFIKRNIPLFGPGALSGYELNDGSKERMARDLAPMVARLTRGMGMSKEDALPLAFHQMYGNSFDVDFIDGAYVPATPASRGQGLFATVAGKVGGMSQLSEDYQQAVRNVITKNMSAAVGAVPVKAPDGIDKAAQVGNNLINAIPFVGEGLPRVFDEKGLMPDPTTFDPDSYSTVSGMAVGGGIVAVTRVPKSSSAGKRPVTVYITADQVISELDELRQKAVDRSRPRPLLQPFSDEAQMYQQMFKQ